MRQVCCFLPSSDIMSNCAARCIYTNVSTLYANFSLASATGRVDHIRNKKKVVLYTQKQYRMYDANTGSERERADSLYRGLCGAFVIGVKGRNPLVITQGNLRINKLSCLQV
jgi:hypothetical protein